MIEISESKVDKMAEYAEKMLKYGGKLMSCIEELEEEDGMGERGRTSRRGGQGESMGYREYERGERGSGERGSGERGSMGMVDSEDWEEMGERRGVRGTGRYSRYRR